MLSQDLSGSLREGHGEREVPGGGGWGGAVVLCQLQGCSFLLPLEGAAL